MLVAPLYTSHLQLLEAFKLLTVTICKLNIQYEYLCYMQAHKLEFPVVMAICASCNIGGKFTSKASLKQLGIYQHLFFTSAEKNDNPYVKLKAGVKFLHVQNTNKTYKEQVFFVTETADFFLHSIRLMMKNQYVESKMDFFSGMKKIRIRNYV